MYSRLIARGVYHVLIRMRVIGPTLVAWMIVATLSPSGAHAQSSYCRSHPDTAGVLVAGLQGAYGEMDSTVLKSKGLPYADPAAISLVTSSNTCKSGVNAYNKARGTGSATLSSAYVLALGNNGFVVINPQEQMGEFTAMWVFDRRWTYKRRLAH